MRLVRTGMDEIREVRLEVMAHGEYGVLARARLQREKARLLRDLAALKREASRIERFRASMAIERSKAVGRQRTFARLLR